jgi:hypothetical protein
VRLRRGFPWRLCCCGCRFAAERLPLRLAFRFPGIAVVSTRCVVLRLRLSVIVNTGSTTTGIQMDDRIVGYLSAILAYSLKVDAAGPESGDATPQPEPAPAPFETGPEAVDASLPASWGNDDDLFGEVVVKPGDRGVFDDEFA